MQIDLKAIFKNKLIIFIFIFLTLVYLSFTFISKDHSIEKDELSYLSLKNTYQSLMTYKSQHLYEAKLQDSTSDKKYYNNYLTYYENIMAEMSALLEKYSKGQDVDPQEVEKLLILKMLVHNERFSGNYGADFVSPYKAYPEKIEKFIKEFDFTFNIADINYFEASNGSLYKDLVAYNTKTVESMIDAYFEKDPYPSTEYSIYTYLRDINFGISSKLIYMMETFSLGILPLVIFYLANLYKKDGTIKNLYLRPEKKYKNYLYFILIFLCLAIFIVYLPRIISYIYVLITGDIYKTKANVTVFEKGLSTFVTSYENVWADELQGFSMTDWKLGSKGDLLAYNDLANISFLKFLSYYLTIDLLKIVLLVITATSICLFIKNKVIAFSLNALIGAMTFLGGKINSRFFLNKFNPFILPNGWKLTLGREYISYFNAFVLLIGWIILMLGISLFLARKRDLE